MPLSAVTRLDVDDRQVGPRPCRRLHYIYVYGCWVHRQSRPLWVLQD